MNVAKCCTTIVFHVVCVLGLLGTITACANGRANDLFESLAHVSGGLHYPFSEERLTTCREKSLSSCLESFQRAVCAARKLREHSDGLGQSLLTIHKTCDPNADAPTKLLCQGALTALSLYNQASDDLAIQQSLRTLPSHSVDQLILTQGGWLSRRENSNRWHAFLEKEWQTLTAVQRKQLLAALAAGAEAREQLLADAMGDLSSVTCPR